MVKRVLAIILATIISFTAVETTGLFFVSANNGENTYCTHPDDKLVHIEANNPTCKKSGGKAYVLCKDCNCVISINGVDLETPATYEKVKDQIIVASDENAHVYDNLKGTRTDPTCTATGIYAYIQCSECNKYYKIISTDEDGVNTYEELTLNGDDVNPDDLVIPKIPHTWGEVTPKVPATCTKEGKEAFAQCSVCQTYAKVTGEDPDYEYEEVESEDALKIDKLDPNGNHTWNEAGIVAVKAATCEDSGISTSYTTCTKCGAYAKVTGDSGNYNYTECTVESDDTNEDGVIDENDFVAPALGHEYGTEEGVNCAAYNAPSCTEDGNYGWVMCTRCNKFYRTTDENGDAIDPYVEIANADAANLEKIDHDYTDLIPQKDATCTEPGLKAHYQCSVCKKYFDATDKHEVEYDDLVILATGHKNIEFVESKDATCLTTGNKEHYKCSDCGQLFLATEDSENCDETYLTTPAEVLPDIGSWRNSTISNNGELKLVTGTMPITSLAQTNSLYVTFDVTGVPEGGARAFLKFTIKSGNSMLAPNKAVNPAIEIPEDGTYTVCYNLLYPVPDAPSYTALSVCIINLDNNNVNNNVGSITLKNVNTTLPETIYLNEATDADIVTQIKSHLDTEYNAKVATAYDDVAATCTDSGWSGGKYCSVCGKVLEARTFVPAKGHNYNQGEVTKEATCTSDGLKTFTCQNANCGSKYTEVIPATGHNYNDGIITKEATCTADGIKTFTCETCNDTYTEVIPAIGHDWDWTLQVTKEPTCIAGGEGEITCKRCDEKEIVIIDKNPSAHKYKNDGICQLCGQKVLTQSGSNVTTSKDTSKNNKKNEKIVKIINSRNKTKVKIKKKKIIIKFSRRGGCKYRIKIYNKKNKEISLKVKQDYMKGNGKKKFKKFYQIKKKGNYRIEIYELKGMKEKNFKDVKCIYLNYKTIK